MNPSLMSSSTRSTVRQLRADVEAICLPKGRKFGSPGAQKGTQGCEQIGMKNPCH